MAHKDKPYRVYRGGRAKGPIRHEPPKERRRQERDGGAPYAGPQPARRRGARWARRGLWLLLGLILLTLVWGVLGYFAFRSGINEANDRLNPRVVRALATQEGLMLSNPSNILLLGADTGPSRKDQGPGRADSIVLVRTDPDEHRIALLSIPRDLRVEIPGHGTDKINAAYALGGPALAVKTVERVTGLRVNHVVVVDFGSFKELIDALGGVTIDVPERIVSNRFDCPYKTQAECDRWPGWRFRRGPRKMDGRRALIYSRIRENRLDPSENDITRGERQQQVLRAIEDKIVSFGTYLRGPFIGDDLAKPLATDLSTTELLQLAWVKKRTPDSGRLRCRLGGSVADIGGVSYILGSEENVSVMAMVTGETAPQPPPPGSGSFGPGCVVGNPGR